MTPEKAIVLGGGLALIAGAIGFLIFDKFMREGSAPKMIVSLRHKKEADKDIKDRKQFAKFSANLSVLIGTLISIPMVSYSYFSGRLDSKKLTLVVLIGSLAMVAYRKLLVYLWSPRDDVGE